MMDTMSRLKSTCRICSKTATVKAEMLDCRNDWSWLLIELEKRCVKVENVK